MIKGALFDMDGTLASTIQYWKEIIPNYIRSFGYDVDESVVGSKIHAMSMKDSATFVCEYYHLDVTPDDVLKSWSAAANRIYTDVAVLKEGAYDFVMRLYDAGIPMVLVTNNEKALADALLTRTGIRHCFKDLYCGFDLGLGKTEPTLIELARKALGTAADDTWMFEDSLGPIATANRIGIHTIAMLDHEHDADEVAAICKEAEMVCNNYDDANTWYDNMIAQ